MIKLLRAWPLLLAVAGPAMAAELIYDTTHSSSLGAEITPTADGPAASLGDRIVLAGVPRRLTELRVEVFALHSAEPFDLTLRLYTDGTTSGAAGSSCGSGAGALIAGSTVTLQVTPPALGTPFPVTFDLAGLDLEGEIDDTVVVSLNASRCDVFWAINEVSLVGSQPAGEPAASVVERCGSVGANSVALDFGLANNFGLQLSADAPPIVEEPEEPEEPGPQPKLIGTKAILGNPSVFRVGDVVTYEVILRNPTMVAQPDNMPADEFTDILPPQLTLISVSPSGFGAVANGNTVTWNGAVPPMGEVILTIKATINPFTEGQTVTNQGRIRSGIEGSENLGLTDATVFQVALPPPAVTGTKTVTGDFKVGGIVTYEVILSNSSRGAQPDNPGEEFIDVFPDQLTLDPAVPPGAVIDPPGTVKWNGVVPSEGTVILTFRATINVGTEGQTVSNQGMALSDVDGDGINELSIPTDDPATPLVPLDATKFVVAPELGKLCAEKSVSSLGSYAAGGIVTYRVDITNCGDRVQLDNAGDEFTDLLPADLILLGGAATGGVLIANTATGRVTWNGKLAPDELAQLFFEAKIVVPMPPGCGTTITNQGSVCFDGDSDGLNETCKPSDDPSLPGESEATSFTLKCKDLEEVPALSPAGLVALALLLAAAAGWRLRR